MSITRPLGVTAVGTLSTLPVLAENTCDKVLAISDKAGIAPLSGGRYVAVLFVLFSAVRCFTTNILPSRQSL